MNPKKLLVLITFALAALLPIQLQAQTSAITATVTDTDGTAWASLNGYNATYTISLISSKGTPIPAGQAFRQDNGATVVNPATGNMSNVGGLSLTLVNNGIINPAGTKWQFVICPAVSSGNCATTALTISTAGSISTQLSAATTPPRIGGGVGNYAYADVEVTAVANSSYYNITTPGLRCYSSSWGACGSAGTGGVTSSIFYIANNCNGLSNCLAWVDDDSTDNCGTATTNFMTQINSYAGPGAANVYIQGSGSGKAYKLVSCNLAFVGPSGTGGLAGSIIVTANATIDCAQTSGSNCIQMGKTGCSTTSFYGAGCHDVTWRGGTIVGCLNLTSACMEVEQGMYINIIDDVNFVNTGAGNGTIGNCTNFSVLWHTFIGGQEFSRNRFWGSVAGQCFSSNNDQTGGANTIIFSNNIISHAPGASCGSIGHYDSSAHSTIENNTIYGWSSNLTLASNGTGGGSYSGDGGWMIAGNNFDYSASCAGNGGVQAEIQFNGTTNNVGPATIINNNVQSSPFIQQAFGSTVSMTGWSVFGNTTYNSSLVQLIGGTGSSTACNQFGQGSGNVTSPCVFGANPGFFQSNSSGSANSGWMILQGNNGHLYSGTCPGATACATNNVTSTAINGSVALTTGLYQVTCQVILTRAATTSSTLPSCVVSWTDLLTSQAETATLTATSGTNTLGTQVNGNTGNISIANASNINVSTTGYATSGTTSMQYGVFADITKVY